MCVGRVFKCVENIFVNKRGHLVYKKVLIPLIRKSCPGCEECGWQWGFVFEDFIYSDGAFFECGIDLSNCEHGHYYKPKIINETKDWETGIVDDWDIGFEEVTIIK
jgi:hypothetical protein